MRRVAAAALLCLLAAGTRAERAADYAAQLRLEVPENAPLLRLTLDARVYRAMRRADLGDLRVFNAAGEALPMARLPAQRDERRFSARVALTPLPAGAREGRASTQVAIEQRAGDTRVQVELGGPDRAASKQIRFLADTESFGRSVNALVVPLPAEVFFEGRLDVETSADLARWRSLASGEAVLAVGAGPARMLRNRIALKGPVERYLRLSWQGEPPLPAPDEVELEHVEPPDAPRRQWLELQGEPSVGHVDYLAPGLFPVDQLRLLPVAGNDVLAARVDSRPGVSARWTLRARSVGYRLERPGELREGAPVALAPTRDPLWRVSAERPETAGAPPLLRLGWVPEEIAFVARGAGPYVLAVGHPDRAPAWLPVGHVVPGYGSASQARLDIARIAEGNPQVNAPARPQSLWQPGRHWWLWAALGLGIALLGWMARGVWRDLNRDKS